jgi:hypothetical protein
MKRKKASFSFVLFLHDTSLRFSPLLTMMMLLTSPLDPIIFILLYSKLTQSHPII